MKQLIIILTFFIFASNQLFAQKTNFTIREVEQFAVFPGCEEKTSKEDLQKCFSQKISQLLADELSDIRYSVEGEFKSRVQFVVSKEGKIVEIKPMAGGNEIFNVKVVEAMQRISNRVKIQPAKLDDGTVVNTIFQLPILYTVNESPTEVQYPSKEIVIFTLRDSQASYEVRLFDNNYLRVFEKIGNDYVYLGKFVNISELYKSEPYKTLIEKDQKTGKSFITDGAIDNKHYEIYMHHLFSRDQKNPIFIEVFEKVGNKLQSIATFPQEIEFQKSIFAPLLYRE